MAVDMSCLLCGAKVSGLTVAEAIQWSDEHDKHCTSHRKEKTA